MSAGDDHFADCRRVSLVLRTGSDVDDDIRDQLTRQLCDELTGLDLQSVELVTDGTLPDGAKVADPVTIGAIVVAMSASGGVFTSLIETVRDWLNRDSDTDKITLTIDGDSLEIDNVSSAERSKLMDAFISRHTTNIS